MCDKLIPFTQQFDETCGGPYNEPSQQCYSGADLESMPQCAPRCPPPRPKCLTIQQPPRLICKKRVIFINKTINEPMIVNRCKQVHIPKVIETTKLIRVPKLTWVTHLIKEPRVIYYPTMIPDPYIVCCPRSICEPREVCQMILCQPKPQYIDIPPPSEYCCYPTGPTKYQPNVMCPISPISQFHQFDPMKSCSNGSNCQCSCNGGQNGQLHHRAFYRPNNRLYDSAVQQQNGLYCSSLQRQNRLCNSGLHKQNGSNSPF